MSLSVIVKKRKKTKSRRISVLPRLAIYLDFGGKELVLKYAPFLEALLNAKRKGKLSLKSLLAASLDQILEIPIQPLSKRDRDAIEKLIKKDAKKADKPCK